MCVLVDLSLRPGCRPPPCPRPLQASIERVCGRAEVDSPEPGPEALQGGPRSAARLCLVLGPTPGKENKPLPTLRGRGSKESAPLAGPGIAAYQAPSPVRQDQWAPKSSWLCGSPYLRSCWFSPVAAPASGSTLGSPGPTDVRGGERRQPILACFAPVLCLHG